MYRLRSYSKGEIFMVLLDGKAVAAFHREKVERGIDVFLGRHIQPGLARSLDGRENP